MEQSPEYHTLESGEIGTPVVLSCLIDGLCNNPYPSCCFVICTGRTKPISYSSSSSGMIISMTAF